MPCQVPKPRRALDRDREPPSYGYYDYGYPPPPVVYPQPGFSINIPLEIR
ncbi:MAG TPA: hypothetical protein VGZ72_01285 [Stellaceae bacterium]|nr:hypothetical protein [Stellaceae bacterium]